MNSFGIMEIFYGQPWSESDRNMYASFLKEIGFNFYIYGPKADDSLRKNWRRPFNTDELSKYRRMQQTFSKQDIKFGMILSPHGLEEKLNLTDRNSLYEKIKSLSDLGLDFFGLFFDDMKSSPNLAQQQLEIVHLVQSWTTAKIIFCPSFYCYDPLLDLLFGDRPIDYLQTLGKELSPSVEVLWTGEQIISEKITAEHLQSVEQILRRKPFLCDNFFANDGPLNCGYLRLLPMSGRTSESFKSASHWAFNPMNQAHLSKIILLAAAKSANLNSDSKSAFEAATKQLVSSETAQFILSNHELFWNNGLEKISAEENLKWRQLLSKHHQGPYEKEIIQWLEGYYAIDFLAMIEQSCYVG